MKSKYFAVVFVIILLLMVVFWFMKNLNKTESNPAPTTSAVSAYPSDAKIENTMEEKTKNMQVLSSAFLQGEEIPAKYTCDGQNLLPPLSITNIPSDALSLAIIVDDPDAPVGTWTHMLLWNLAPQKTEIAEGDTLKDGVWGTNDFGNANYGGPCPPSGTHRYFFKVYAINKNFNIPERSKRKVVENELKDGVISEASLMGVYSKK